MSRGTLDPAVLTRLSRTGLSPSLAGLPRTILLGLLITSAVRTPECTHSGLGSSGFARRYFRNRLFSFSSSGYLDVSVHRVPSVYLWIQYTVHEVCSCGFPHSDIHGSKVICTSPWLFAAYHVFHRLSVPRHPPCALSCLTFVVPQFPAVWFSRCIPLMAIHKGHAVHLSRKGTDGSMLSHLFACYCHNIWYNYLSIMTRLLDVLG